MTCPNRSSDAWKALVSALGSETLAYVSYTKNNDTILDPAQAVAQFKREEPTDKQKEEHSNILLDIRDRLVKLLSIYTKRIKNEEGKKIIDSVESLKRKLESIDSMDGIEEYIKTTAKIVADFEKNINIIKANPDDLSNIGRLTTINGFISIFDNLKSLQTTMFRDLASDEKLKAESWLRAKGVAEAEGRLEEFLKKEPQPIQTTQILDEAIQRIDVLHTEYLKYGIPLMAKRLFALIPKETIDATIESKNKLLAKNPNSSRAKSMVTTEEELADQMRVASRDISGYEKWLYSSMGGSDVILALTAKMIKESTQTLVDDLMHDEHELGLATDEYAKATGLPVNDPAKFNEPIIETVGKYDAEGNVAHVKQFVEKYDRFRFETNRREFFKSVEHLPKKKRSAEIRAWYAANQRNIDGAYDIIAAKKKELSAIQWAKWSAKNIKFIEGTTRIRGLKGDLVEPVDAYINPKWEKMHSKGNEHVLKYHTLLTAKYDEIKALIPEKVAKKMGNSLPFVYISDWERGLTGVGKIIRDKVKMTADDINYGITDTSGKMYKDIPVHFTNSIPAENTTSDVLSVLLKASKNWREYGYKAGIQQEIQLLTDIMRNRDAAETNAKGENLIDKLSLKVDSRILKSEMKNFQARFNDMLDTVYYGQEDEKSIVNILGQDVSLDKVAGVGMFISSSIQLSGNWIAGISNTAMGNVMNFAEAASGRFFNSKEWAEGYKDYTMGIPNYIADRNKLTGKSIDTQLEELYEPQQGSYQDMFGNNVSGNAIKKNMDTSNLFFINNMAEHSIQGTAFRAMLRATKFIDGKFQGRPEYVGNATGKERAKLEAEFDSVKITLKDAYELDEKGKLKLKDEYKDSWTVTQRQEFKNRMHRMNEKLHGNYAKFDKNSLQRLWYGKLAIMFRKYIVPGVQRRFSAERVDYALGTVEQGIYTSTVNFLIDTVKEMRRVGVMEAMGTAFKEITPLQRQNLRRTLVEAFSMMLMMLIVGTLGDDDGEKNTYAENLLLLEARRIQAEISFYVNFLDAYRIVKSPAVAMGTVESMAKFGYGLLFIYGEDDLYKRKTGLHEKGDSKDWARLQKLIPILKSIQSGLTPEEQYKTFNKLI